MTTQAQAHCLQEFQPSALYQLQQQELLYFASQQQQILLDAAATTSTKSATSRFSTVKSLCSSTSTSSKSEHNNASLKPKQQPQKTKNGALSRPGFLKLPSPLIQTAQSCRSSSGFPSPPASPMQFQDLPSTTAEKYLENYPLHPDFVANYTIVSELGTGGFGFVVHAIRHSDNKNVAVKFIFKHRVPTSCWVQDQKLGRIPLEAYLLRTMNHESIVEFLDWYDDKCFGYMVMSMHGSPWSSPPTHSTSEAQDYARLPSPALSYRSTSTISSSSSMTSSSSGSSSDSMNEECNSCGATSKASFSARRSIPRRNSQDLFEAIEFHSRFSEAQARFVFRQIVDAVRYLHSRGICHRDIKDENILVDKELRVKLIDFGSAAPIMSPTTGKPELYDRFYGTIQYASPEILRGQKYQGPGAEIWALGCCLFIMLNGEIPFSSPCQAIRGQMAIPKQELSPEVIDLLRIMLCPDPKHRATISQVWSHPWLHQFR